MSSTELEPRPGAGPVTTVRINRTSVLGRQYRRREPDLPTLTARVDVPPELVDAARELYRYYHDAPDGRSPPNQTFADYLHDVVMDRLEIEFRYPPDGPSP